MSRSVGFGLAAYAFAVAMLSTTLPTPLYPHLEQRYSFGELQVTVIYAVYAFGVIAGLVALGNLSDHVGRRPMLQLGLVLAAVSGLLFLFGSSLGPIYVARVVTGVSAGIFTGTATAYLVDLAPRERRRRTSQLAVVVNLGGLGCGTLLSGLLAAYVGHPLRLPFAVDLALVAVAIAGLLAAPETVERAPGLRWRPQRLGVPAEIRSVFARAATAGFAASAVAGILSSVGPGFLATELHHGSPALAGLLIFLFMSMSLAGQLILRRLPERHGLAAGCAFLAAGATLLGVAIGVESSAALFASAIVAGLGQGVVFGAALAAINQRAPAERRGESASSFFVVTYVGLSVPVIAAGITIEETSLKTAGIGFSAAVTVLVLAVLASQLRAAG
ncbi:MAG TPA: MFS transporter [Gaiellaceae bacterium]|nr:MFS transporter [Gaiellaceae bacterium]